MAGSLCIDHKLGNIIVPLGMVYPWSTKTKQNKTTVSFNTLLLITLGIHHSLKKKKHKKTKKKASYISSFLICWEQTLRYLRAEAKPYQLASSPYPPRTQPETGHRSCSDGYWVNQLNQMIKTLQLRENIKTEIIGHFRWTFPKNYKFLILVYNFTVPSLLYHTIQWRR